MLASILHRQLTQFATIKQSIDAINNSKSILLTPYFTVDVYHSKILDPCFQLQIQCSYLLLTILLTPYFTVANLDLQASC